MPWRMATSRRGRRRGATRPGRGDRRRRLAVPPPWILPALFAFGLGLGVALGPRGLYAAAEALQPGGLELRRVRVVGAARVPAAVYARAAAVPGTPLAALDPDAIAARLERLPWVRRARALPLPPDRLWLRVEERTGRAVARDAAGWLRVVDGSGRPFAAATPEEAERLPRIAGRFHPARREDLRRLRRAVVILRAFEAVPGARPREVAVEPAPNRAATVTLEGLPGRVVLGEGALAPQLERLRRVLAELPDASSTAGEIDLRFGRQVVLRGHRAAPGRVPLGARSARHRGSPGGGTG